MTYQLLTFAYRILVVSYLAFLCLLSLALRFLALTTIQLWPWLSCSEEIQESSPDLWASLTFFSKWPEVCLEAFWPTSSALSPQLSAQLRYSHQLCQRWLVLSFLHFCTWPRPKTRQRCLMTQQSLHLLSPPLTWLPCSWWVDLMTILPHWTPLSLSAPLCSRSSTLRERVSQSSMSTFPSPCLAVSVPYSSMNSFTRRFRSKFRRTKVTTLLEELTTTKMS